MDKKQHDALRRKARQIASAYGVGHLADEFSQEALLARSLGSQRSLEHMAIDYFRKEFGQPLPSGPNPRYMERMKSIEVSKNHLRGRPKDPCEIDFLVKDLDPRDRASVLLAYVWDFTNDEIGFLFGISGPAISIRLKSLRAYLKRRAEQSGFAP